MFLKPRKIEGKRCPARGSHTGPGPARAEKQAKYLDKGALVARVRIDDQAELTTALEELQRTRQQGRRPDTRQYERAIVACGRAKNQHGMALELLDRMRSEGVRRTKYCYDFAVQAQCNAGDPRAGLALLNRMKEDGIPPDVYTFNRFTTGFARIAKWEDARGVLEEMRRRT